MEDARPSLIRESSRAGHPALCFAAPAKLSTLPAPERRWSVMVHFTNLGRLERAAQGRQELHRDRAGAEYTRYLGRLQRGFLLQQFSAAIHKMAAEGRLESIAARSARSGVMHPPKWQETAIRWLGSQNCGLPGLQGWRVLGYLKPVRSFVCEGVPFQPKQWLAPSLPQPSISLSRRFLLLCRRPPPVCQRDGSREEQPALHPTALHCAALDIASLLISITAHSSPETQRSLPATDPYTPARC